MALRTRPICSAKANCTDSRPKSDHVRRNYICPNKHSYTTAEFIIDTGGRPVRDKVKKWLDANRNGPAASTLAQIRQLLASPDSGPEKP